MGLRVMTLEKEVVMKKIMMVVVLVATGSVFANSGRMTFYRGAGFQGPAVEVLRENAAIALRNKITAEILRLAEVEELSAEIQALIARAQEQRDEMAVEELIVMYMALAVAHLADENAKKEERAQRWNAFLNEISE